MLLGARPGDSELHYTKARAISHFATRKGRSTKSKSDPDRGDPRFAALQAEARSLSARRGVSTLEREAKNLLETGRDADRDRALAIVSGSFRETPITSGREAVSSK